MVTVSVAILSQVASACSHNMQAVLRAAIAEFAKGLVPSFIVLAGQQRCPPCPDCHCAPVFRCSGGERAQEDIGAADHSVLGFILVLAFGVAVGWADAYYTRATSASTRARPVVKGKGRWLTDISDSGAISSEHGGPCALPGARTS